ncbi:MAG: hypothetical protein MUD07_07205 [Burkholderiaceae bacterium]|nr:hypothetical protein [Burkholderiaceae bacterium]
MKRIAWALAVAAVLAGCAGFERNPRLPNDDGFDPGLVSRPRPTEPNVLVVGGQLVIDQEPIRIWKRDLAAGNRVVIAWALPAGSAAGWLPNPPEARRPGPHPSEGPRLQLRLRLSRALQVHADGRFGRQTAGARSLHRQHGVAAKPLRESP